MLVLQTLVSVLHSTATLGAAEGELTLKLPNSGIVATASQGAVSGNEYPVSDAPKSYLPGRGDTMIKKVVHPGRGSATALRLC